jgi:predicted transcriptional regulator
MDDISTFREIDRRLIAKIVSSYVKHHAVGPDELVGLIASVRRCLGDLGKTAAPAARIPAVPVRRSVRPDYVVCLECGLRGTTIRRHLRMVHGLAPEAYRSRWGLSSDHPITAPAYSKRRSALAKQLGLGRRRRQIDLSPPVPGTLPVSKRRGRKPSQPATIAPEAVPTPAPKQRGRKSRTLVAA